MRKRIVFALSAISVVLLFVSCTAAILNPGLEQFNKARAAYTEKYLGNDWSNVGEDDSFTISMRDYSPEYSQFKDFNGTIHLSVQRINGKYVTWNFAKDTDVSFTYRGNEIHIKSTGYELDISGSITQDEFNDAVTAIVDDVMDYEYGLYHIPAGITSVYMSRGKPNLGFEYYVMDKKYDEYRQENVYYKHYYTLERFIYSMEYKPGMIAPSETFDIAIRDHEDKSRSEIKVDKIGSDVNVTYGGGGGMIIG